MSNEEGRLKFACGAALLKDTSPDSAPIHKDNRQTSTVRLPQTPPRSKAAQDTDATKTAQVIMTIIIFCHPGEA